MIVVAYLFGILLLAVYSALWLVLAFVLRRVQRRRRLSLFEWDGSLVVLALRVILVAMLFFPPLEVFLYVPLHYADMGQDVLVKPRLIEDWSISCCVAAAAASCASVVFWLGKQRRVRVPVS